MNLNRLIHPDDNPDLTEERLKATFDTDVLASILKGNKKNLARSRALKDEVNKRPALSDSKPVGHMTREEKFENATRKTIELIKDIANFANPMDRLEADTVFRQVLGIEGFPLALHFLMFLPTIQNQADDEQQDWWLTKTMSMKILGTYAQTEMGHGTNLSKIETLATYDRDAEEFILHSPTTTSLKWWPGGLGNTVNHVALVANLIIDGKSYGPHIFFVQIRDLETHKALSNVKVGDIGSKMGLQSVDNGFLGFDQFRIPRRNMLMKYAKVDKNGTYHPPIHSKVTYSTMTFVRAEIVLWQSLYLMYATTIATRYSCVRRQGEIVQGEGEVKVIDYQTQQNRLFPAISKAYAYWFAAEEIRNRTTDSINNMKQNQVDEAVLADLHAASCCLKAFVTFEGSKSLEQCRMACGGHGYSEASYLPTVYTVGVATATYEGENLVLLLQTARYLMRAAAAARNGGRLGPSVEFLRQVGQTHSLIDKVPQADYSHYLHDFEHVARKQIFAAHDRLEQLKRNGMSNEAAWTENGVEMTRASRTFARLLVARYFFATVQKIDDSRCREVIGDLLHLHLNQDVVAQAKYLLENGYMNGDQIKHIKEDVFRLYRRIRPNAVSLVDSYDVQDEELRSVLGRRDGHVYENLFKWAQQSPLNQHTDGVSPVFEKYLKSLTSDDEKSKL